MRKLQKALTYGAMNPLRPPARPEMRDMRMIGLADFGRPMLHVLRPQGQISLWGGWTRRNYCKPLPDFGYAEVSTSVTGACNAS